jgi:uncharacterized membrane protein YqiK
MRTYRKTKRHRNRKTRKHGGENEINDEMNWNAITPRPRGIITPPSLSTQELMRSKELNMKHTTNILNNARESKISKLINQNLAKNAAIRQFYENNAARASVKASAKASAKKASNAEANAKRAKAAAIQATVNQLMSRKKEKIINSSKYTGPGSRINQNKRIDEWAAQFRAYEPNSVYF